PAAGPRNGPTPRCWPEWDDPPYPGRPGGVAVPAGRASTGRPGTVAPRQSGTHLHARRPHPAPGSWPPGHATHAGPWPTRPRRTPHLAVPLPPSIPPRGDAACRDVTAPHGPPCESWPRALAYT